MFTNGDVSQHSSRTQIFYGAGISPTTLMIPYHIPPDYKKITFILVGPGGGGAGGVASTAGTSRRGGGGGGGGGVSISSFNTNTLPNVVYLSLPGGGVGGASDTSATNPDATANVLTSPETTIVGGNVIIQSNRGLLGNVSGSGGTGGASINTGNSFASLLYTSYASVSGGNASTSGVAVATASLSYITVSSGGAAGGSTNLSTPFAGGNIVIPSSGSFYLPTNYILSKGGAAGGGDGAGGISNLPTSLFSGEFTGQTYAYGGSGGGAVNSGTGGRGGDGAPGCGGGGGGAGTTGGRGGDGGPSYCIVILE